jgi:uncharacterized protein
MDEGIRGSSGRPPVPPPGAPPGSAPPVSPPGSAPPGAVPGSAPPGAVPPRPPTGRPRPPQPVGDPAFGDPVDLRDRSAAGAFRVPFSVADAFVAMIVFIAGQLVAGVILGVLLAVTGAPPEDAPMTLLALGGQGLGFALALAYLRARRRLSWRLLGPVRPSWLLVAIGLGVGVVGTFGAYTINAVLVQLAGAEAPVEQELLNEVLAGGRATVLAILVAVVMAPLVEEVLFRGLLFQAIRRRLGLWPAALLSSAVFTAIHVEIVFSQPLALVGLFALGVLLAWSFHRSGSLLVPILAHAVFNGVSLTLVVMVDRFSDLL